MTDQPAMFPDAVFTIWWIGLIVTLVLFVPMAVYYLNRTFLAARSIQRFAADALQAAAGIAGNTANIVALDTTIEVAGQILGTAGNVAGKLGTIADVLEQRAQ
ncbi:MAG: hypothetical protein H0T48_06470 [Gemmatimonadaceae bacterium]|nr:hypothetical protein [Gemmatimonadaceae bacterium]